MNLAFWRARSPDEQANRLAAELAALPEETRALVLRGEGVRNLIEGGWTTSSGFGVSATTAFTGTVAVYACVALIAESNASLPLLTYRRIDDDRRERISERNDTGPKAWQNRLARMLHSTPNPEMTSQEFWETVYGHLLLWGNAYCNVVRDNGRPTELWPLRPDRMEIERDERGIRRYRYYLATENRYIELRPAEVMHLRGMSLDGVMGISPIKVARNAIAIAQAVETFAEGFFRRGASVGGMLIADPPLSGNIEHKREQLQLLREGFEAIHGGMTNAHRVAALSGVRWQDVGMPLDDAQMIETRKFQLLDVARLYRIPPYKVGVLEPGAVSYASVEQQAIGFVTDTLRPWMTRVEKAINRDLGFPGQDATTLLDESIYAEFKVDALLRGDQKSRYDSYGVGLDKKFLVVNDVRRLENLEPVPWGDEPNVLPGEAGPLAEAADAQRMTVEELTLALQKIYLSVGVVITPEEARDILNRGGADLPTELPEGLGPKFGPKEAPPESDEPEQPMPMPQPQGFPQAANGRSLTAPVPSRRE